MINFLFALPVTASGKSVIKETITRKEGKMPLFNAKEIYLKNGLRVIMIKTLSQAVSVSILYKIGTADDPEPWRGLSHFLEHMMFRGTKKYPGNVFKEKVASMGGYVNAFTSFDITCYVNRVPKEALEEILELEADRMVNLQYKESDIQAERKAVEEEYSMSIGNNAMGPVAELIYRSLYLYHPYGVLPIGYPQHIKAYTRQNAFDWYKKWYHPNNAILMIAGDFDFAQAQKLVEKHFDHLKPGEIPERKRISEPEIKGATRYIKQENERFASPMVELIYDAPAKNYVYNFARYMLGGGALSLFYNHFVRKINQGVQDVSMSHYFSLKDNPNDLSLSFDLSPNVLLQKVVFDELEAYKKELLSGYLDSDEFKERFENAKKRQIANLIHETDGTQNAVEAFVNMVGFDIPFDEINNYAEIIENISLEDVKKAIIEILTKKPKVVFVGVPNIKDQSNYAFLVN